MSNTTNLTECAHYRMRPLRQSDLPVFTSWMEQIEDLAMFDRRMPLPVSPEAVKKIWRKAILAKEPRSSNWFVILDQEERLVGAAGLEEIDYVHGNAILPVFIAQGSRRRGLALRALAMLLDMAFDQLRLTRVTTYYRADNENSQKLCTSVGFTEEGVMRRSCFAGGEYVDVHVIGMLEEEWAVQRERLQRELGGDVVLTLGRNVGGRWSWPQPQPQQAVESPQGAEIHRLRIPQ